MIETKLLGKELKSPLILASGTLGETKQNLIKALEYGAGAVVNRTVRIDNTLRKPFRRSYFSNEQYMLNADNNNKTPWKYWINSIEEIEKHGSFVMSLSARNPKNSQVIAKALEENYPPSYYELNFSCSHSAKLYGKISYDDVTASLRYLREFSKKPIFLKLSVDNIDLENMKRIEDEKLADAYVISNTIGPGLAIDTKSMKPKLDSVVGGISGPAIKPIVLAKIYEIMPSIKLPIIGCGGITNANDVLEYLSLGCPAVQVYTEVHLHGLISFDRINNELNEILSSKGQNLKDIIGKFWEGDCLNG